MSKYVSDYVMERGSEGGREREGDSERVNELNSVSS